MRAAVGVTTFTLALTACRIAAAPGTDVPPPLPSATDPHSLLAEVDRLAARDLWPGFDARHIPVAIYDGEHTLLFHHPAPPEGFRPVAGRDGVWMFRGRHPSVTANSSTDLGGVQTATAMPPAVAVPLTRRVGLLIHEAFHVFQRQRHPGWSANEVELFSYPVDDVRQLALRRLETDALRRALRSGMVDSTACWTRTALDLRRDRFAVLATGAVAYERQTELNEGLATYVERRAIELSDSIGLPAADFSPDAVRARAYETGAALALLLDRLRPAWRATLERTDTLSLESLLGSAPALRTSGAAACPFSSEERERARAAAGRDIDDLRNQRAERRRSFLEQSGWRLIVISDGSPLFPQRFDPLNVHTVAAGEVLHTRFLKLGNQSGVVEVLGRAALTEAAGDHPLFDGVRRVILTGLAIEPTVTDASGSVSISTEGVTAQFQGARLERSGQTVTIRLPR